MATGTIKRLNERGFGFIKEAGSNSKQDVFFHATDVDNPTFKELEEGDEVSFEVAQGERGPRAQNVTRI